MTTPRRRVGAIALTLGLAGTGLTLAGPTAQADGAATATPAQVTAAQAAAKPKKKNKIRQQRTRASRHLRKAVRPRGIREHLRAFQDIADANDGTRASGTPGYRASRDYVVERLRAAGYHPRVQSFEFPFFKENAPAQLSQVSPDPTDYTSPADFSTMDYSGSGDVTAEVIVVDTDLSPSETSTSGCEAEDFADFPDGAIALIQRGTCAFGLKAQNAADAGAVGAIIFNRGTEGAEGTIAGTLGTPVPIPVVGASYALGQDLADPGTTVHLVTDTQSDVRTTWNVTAEIGRNDGNVVMAGAHLDGVVDGPGINDNASGSSALLEIAEHMKRAKPRNTVRFAWWGAEESGLLGAEHYVGQLAEHNPGALRDIRLYLNFDMVGSPNFVRFVYDGNNSAFGEEDGAAIGPRGSAAIERTFLRYFKSQRLATSPTPFDGRSDYGPFIDAGIPAGGLFTGAEGVKTEQEAEVYGGTAGEAYDPCYHQACDDLGNVSMRAINQMSDAMAHSIAVYGVSTRGIK